MERRVSCFSIISVFICIIIVFVIIVSALEINKRHQEKLLYSMKSNVEYYAKRCYLEGNCKGKVTLEELQNKKYIDEIVNPVTKEVLDKKTEIEFKDNKIIVNW